MSDSIEFKIETSSIPQGKNVIPWTGTVSAGTMQGRDLVPAFLGVLHEYHPNAYWRILGDILAEFPDYLDWDDENENWHSDNMSYFLNEDIWDAMQEIVPEGVYFGAHPGDSADYGFWNEDYDDEDDEL